MNSFNIYFQEGSDLLNHIIIEEEWIVGQFLVPYSQEQSLIVQFNATNKELLICQVGVFEISGDRIVYSLKKKILLLHFSVHF